jgi:hypothetical protein
VATDTKEDKVACRFVAPDLVVLAGEQYRQQANPGAVDQGPYAEAGSGNTREGGVTMSPWQPHLDWVRAVDRVVAVP